jgi:hypothetical protein
VILHRAHDAGFQRCGYTGCGRGCPGNTFGTTRRKTGAVEAAVPGFPSPFGSDDSQPFDGYDAFVPAHLPDPGAFLESQSVLTGDDHVLFHRLTRALFEDRGAYDVTFTYNLARLNLDGRHENAGFRYAEEFGNPSVLRAEFTPTTPFCPQTSTLVVGAFRAWNGLSDRHEYRLVRVRTAQMHYRGDEIDDRLRSLEDRYLETGALGDAETAVGQGRPGGDDPTRRDEQDTPF